MKSFSKWPGGHREYLTETGLLRAALDTSFWVAGYRAEVVANGFDFFDLIVPSAIESEILARQWDQPQREYPYATLFRQLRQRMVDPPMDAPSAIALFGPGEAAAIALARALPAILLINEQRGAVHARNMGIPVVTVPSFIVALRGLDVVSDRAARRKLDLIEPITTPGFIEEARQMLDLLA